MKRRGFIQMLLGGVGLLLMPIRLQVTAPSATDEVFIYNGQTTITLPPVSESKGCAFLIRNMSGQTLVVVDGKRRYHIKPNERHTFA